VTVHDASLIVGGIGLYRIEILYIWLHTFEFYPIHDLLHNSLSVSCARCFIYHDYKAHTIPAGAGKISVGSTEFEAGMNNLSGYFLRGFERYGTTQKGIRIV